MPAEREPTVEPIGRWRTRLQLKLSTDRNTAEVADQNSRMRDRLESVGGGFSLALRTVAVSDATLP